MAINSENGTVYFSVLTGEDKENFVCQLIHKQLQLSKFMCSIYSNSSILQDHTILMEAVEKSNIPKIIAERLNGTMTFVQFSQIFLEVMDENIK